MGEVIAMFTREPVPGEPFDLEAVLTEELETDVWEAIHRLGELWTASTADDFRARMREVKAQVAGWPDD